MPETPKEKPAEQQELAKKQAELIIKAIDDGASRLKKYELYDRIVKEEKDCKYEITLSHFLDARTEPDAWDPELTNSIKKASGSLRVDKYEKGFFKDTFDGRIDILYNATYREDPRTNFLTVELHVNNPGATESIRAVRLKFENGQMTVEGDNTLLKEKADKFLGIVNDYINEHTTKTFDPQKAKDF